MKKLILFTGFYFCILSVFGQITNTSMPEDTIVLKRDTVMRNLLMSVNLKNYLGKTVDELLQNDTIKMNIHYSWTDEPPGKLQSLDLTFAKGLYLKIYPVRKNGQAVQLSLTNNFDIEAFKKMKIQELIIDKEYFEEHIIKKHSRKN